MTDRHLDRAVEPHENVTIGNFIYSLGMLVGYFSKQKETSCTMACINLIQQTPNDAKIGDVLASFPGAVRILEFKRSTNPPKKEQAKVRYLKQFLSRETHLTQVSHGIHWYAETLAPNNKNLDIRARPYLMLESKGCNEELSLLDFTANFAREIVAQKVAFPMTLVQEYLESLPKLQDQTSKSTSAGGLVVCMDKEKGIRYMPIRDFRELSLTFGEIRADYHRQFELQQQMNLEYEKSLSKGVSLGRYRI